MSIAIITIHKGSPVELCKTLNSSYPLLTLPDVCGHIVYDSSEYIADLSLYCSPKIKYIHAYPGNGIVSALNCSFLAVREFFPDSTHHIFIHSGDVFDPCFTSDAIERGCIITSAEVRDLNFYGYTNVYKDRCEKLLPMFSKIYQGMTVSHVGTIISNSLFEAYGLYQYQYKFAMDYHFFLWCRLSHASFSSNKLSSTCIDMGGISSIHPYRALWDTTKARFILFSKLRREYVHPSFYSLLAYIKRFVFDAFSLFLPSGLILNLRFFNKRLIK
ncbi:hypothetical protein [Synechococcus sp. TAK9802]|uniref:hypothetical protein n=1 Tax=Synechococcus sp. TAK9802 TaxID=1442558 RepID=UPI001647D057|nr:hypothetical protein [Synechococcus sp. TAK9802]QNI60499.1 nucleotide-diphospho-sugar transferase [Synechococcus sp. TAK9802]